MSTKVYIMSRDGWTDYWELRVSKNQKEMAKDILKTSKAWGGEVGVDTGTHGLVHPMVCYSGQFATCFLHGDRLGAGVVAHEMLHVAMAHERFVLHFGMGYGDEIGDDEERLAYYLTNLMTGVYNTLYENKHIKATL